MGGCVTMQRYTGPDPLVDSTKAAEMKQHLDAITRDYVVIPRVDYSTIDAIKGPLVILNRVKEPQFNEIVNITLGTGEKRRGQILEVDGDKAVVQVFEGTTGIDNRSSHVELTGTVLKVGVSEDMLGRIFNGAGTPIDKKDVPVLADDYLDVAGMPINPFAREYPEDMRFLFSLALVFHTTKSLLRFAARLVLSRSQANRRSCPTSPLSLVPWVLTWR